jgi:hypothetical protein
LCGVIEKYQTEFLTIEVTEKLNEKSYRNLKIAIGLLSTLVTIIGGALGTVLGLTFAGPAGAIAGGVTGSIISGGIAYCLANTFFPPPPTTTHANTLAAKVMIEKSKELIKCAQENGFEDETGMKVYTFLTLPFRASL